MKYISFFILACSLTWLSGCDKDDKVEPPKEGIIYSPIIPYQEALPGSIISFSVRVASPEVVNTFGVRFKFPNTTDYVSLPQYPDITKPTEFASGFSVFEYALPPSATAINADMKFKFIATTASKTYENEYTVRMKTTGGQAARLYGPINYSYTRFGAMDLLTTAGVQPSAPALTKDITSLMATIPYEGKDYDVLAGFTSANGTKFKLSAVADFNMAPTQYAARYAAIAATNEFTSLSVTGAVAALGQGVLAGNTYYLAKINRNGVFSYAAIAVRKIPAAALQISGEVPVQAPGSDVLDLEIKK